ncbi:uncharacterized protein CCR75_002643 [Bremia lactucae]|uniref:DNA repair protein REV1 n=1 Tax=Bremia lactucae TaxID=4779 RepID=A0A976IBX3_BRELC|nr:hypothetical protein CCR75_002643 [Bremia lactucae]
MRRSGDDGVGNGAGRKRVGEHHDGSFNVYMSHKVQKLRGQNESFAAAMSSSPCGNNTTAIFRGVHVYVDGYTVPSKEEIRQLMLLHGGGFEHYDTGRVTHVIATHLPASKLLQLQKAKKPLPVVHPDWILQSIEQNKLLPLQRFLYTGLSDPTQSSILNLSNSEVSVEKTDDDICLDAAVEASERNDNDDNDEDQFQMVESPSIVRNRNSTPKLRTNSTKDGPDFVRHYFAKSRLHHIGTWRATFQQKAAEFQAAYKGPAVTKASVLSNNRVILHVDMDCFFVAVAVRGKPELKNVPVAIAHSDKAGSSEVSSCNYLARAKGVSAGMYMQLAKEKCPELVVLPYQFDAIQRVSFQIYKVFFSHTPYVQAISCDEAFLEFGHETNGMVKAETIRQEIHEQTGCIASVGVSFNMLLAKLSSTKAKPDGIFQLATLTQAENFLLSRTVRDLPGAGHVTVAKLEAIGIQTVQQLMQLTKNELIQSVGKAFGEMLYNYARGIDTRALSMELNMMRKSVSAVVNFGIRFEKWDDATVFLMALGEELGLRLRNLKVRAQCLTLLIKKRAEGARIEPSKFMGHGICDNFSKSHVLPQATDDDVVIGKTCIELLRQFDFPSHELRGVGVQATKLISDISIGNQRRGQLFTAWLEDSAQNSKDAAGSNSTSSKTIASRAGSNTDTNTNEFEATTFSQINMEVLEELPKHIQREVLASYKHDVPRPTNIQLKHNGKAPLRRKQRARNIFSSKSNSKLARHAHSSGKEKSGRDNALNDIRMSQIDSEVYNALPYQIRKEIDRYAKKRTSTSRVAMIPKPILGINEAVHKTSASSVVLPTIKMLFENLLHSLQMATSADDKHRATSSTQAPSNAFDALYSRILVEVENRSLDEVLRMLRFVRRKSNAAISTELDDKLKRGFNHILGLVNQDIQRCFNGVLPPRLVAPL